MRVFCDDWAHSASMITIYIIPTPLKLLYLHFMEMETASRMEKLCIHVVQFHHYVIQWKYKVEFHKMCYITFINSCMHTAHLRVIALGPFVCVSVCLFPLFLASRNCYSHEAWICWQVRTMDALYRKKLATSTAFSRWQTLPCSVHLLETVCSRLTKWIVNSPIAYMQEVK